MSARQWTVRVTAPAQFLNTNKRLHGRAAAQTVKAWRDAGNTHARAAKLPALGKARITATLHFTDRKRRDDHNYFPTVKALIDGLVDYGLLPDDSREYLLGTTICGGEPVAKAPFGPAGVVVLTICEVA